MPPRAPVLRKHIGKQAPVPRKEQGEGLKRTSAPGKAGALVIFSFASALFGAFRPRGLGLRCGGVGRVDVMIQILDEAAAALVLLVL